MWKDWTYIRGLGFIWTNWLWSIEKAIMIDQFPTFFRAWLLARVPTIGNWKIVYFFHEILVYHGCFWEVQMQHFQLFISNKLCTFFKWKISMFMSHNSHFLDYGTLLVGFSKPNVYNLVLFICFPDCSNTNLQVERKIVVLTEV
jgi:hypothetical protein